jgi:hypothetical protein
MLLIVVRRSLSCHMLPEVVLSLWKRGRCAQSLWQLATKWTVRGLITHLGQEIFSCVISGFHRDVDETYALLGSYTACSGNLSSTFRSTYQSHLQELRVMTTTHCVIAQTSAVFNCNKTNSDLCLRNMGNEINHNSETISLWEENFKKIIWAHKRKLNMESQNQWRIR